MLEDAGGPYDPQSYRDAVCATVPGYRDASFGGVAHDGTRAAIALLEKAGVAESVPYGYGGIVATRPLSTREQASFLDIARREARAPRLIARAVDGLGGALKGDAGGVASVVHLAHPPEARFAKKARQSIRRAERAGAVVSVSGDGAQFVKLYEAASSDWNTRYPSLLILQLGRSGSASFYDVRLGAQVVSSIAVLRAPTHWMYWLAAQTDEGRKHELGYLAVSTMLVDAYNQGLNAVNLGASAGLPGAAAFKRRLGGVDHPYVVARSATVRAQVRFTAERFWRAAHSSGRRRG